MGLWDYIIALALAALVLVLLAVLRGKKKAGGCACSSCPKACQGCAHARQSEHTGSD